MKQPQRRRNLGNQSLRRKLILSIISGDKVHNQCELRVMLKEAGLDVTQATLSRDLKALGIARVFDLKSGYVYVQSPNGERITEDALLLKEDLIREIRDIKFSGNLAVIKTKLGYATGVAYEIDQLKIPDIIGTIGGDDTILVVFRENVDKQSLLTALRK
jgi:transcriptional regulator of arginine metabolism